VTTHCTVASASGIRLASAQMSVGVWMFCTWTNTQRQRILTFLESVGLNSLTSIFRVLQESYPAPGNCPGNDHGCRSSNIALAGS
jgi:hypothetical protein